MYYLKYRPKTIEGIDNTRVKETLLKILESKNIPHALLFVGQKGTGKTSSARIFAKAVNCLHNIFTRKSKSIEPCNICTHCISIDNSSFTDVLEMDAASNRGIEEVKNLIKETAFLPMVGRYRVFIIDEAHMITPDGFNALLKTLEEPPSTVIFILATTVLEKLPKTIVSRCIKINFGKAKKEDIVHMLKRIIHHEKITVDDTIIKLIAQHSDYSFRDAAKLLEEIHTQNISSKEEAEKYLGVKGKSNLLNIIGKKSLQESLLWIKEFADGGGNCKTLIEQILDELRMAFLAKKGVENDSEPDILFSVSEITLLIKLLMDAYAQMRATPIESLPLEIAVAEFYNKKGK